MATTGGIRVVVTTLFAAAVLGACTTAAATPTDFVDVPGIGVTRIDVPRPSSSGGPACTVAIVPGQSVAQRAVALREIGLFSDRAALSDATLGSEVERGVAERWEGAIGPDDPLIELAVAEQDANRVWWQDLEADVLDGNDVYEWTLGGWSAISAGTFMPENVVESWASETGPVTVAFELAGEPHVLTPAYLEDWIDPTILTSINALIAPAGRQFALFQAFDQTAFVMALTDTERTALEQRGWCFE